MMVAVPLMVAVSVLDFEFMTELQLHKLRLALVTLLPESLKIEAPPTQGKYPVIFWQSGGWTGDIVKEKDMLCICRMITSKMEFGEFVDYSHELLRIVNETTLDKIQNNMVAVLRADWPQIATAICRVKKVQYE
jgi:hypothetical protein